MVLAGCGAVAGGGEADSASSRATSADDFGGMDGLVAAAQKEGQLNVVGLADDWVNYGEMMSEFEKRYGITVNSASPDASSAEGIQAAKNLDGQDTAPDVFDTGIAVATANTDMFAPYKVSTWDTIPEGYKEDSGRWVNAFSGVMSLGYDSSRLSAPEKLADLLGPEYKSAVSMGGDPTQTGGGFAAVGWLSLLNGGSLDDFGPGIDFVSELKDAGNLLMLDPTPTTIATGEVPMVIDWSFAQLEVAHDMPSWKSVVLDGPTYVSFYSQSINKNAPHPAAARLWEEWVFSNEGQDIYLRGNGVPVRLADLEKAGAVNPKDVERATLGTDPSTWSTPTIGQIDDANSLLTSRWSKAVG
ncbi:putative spermidine/putrescine transport system substrate-binding protein [Microbacterium azadirachtae]|uniref:Putative spermidine/putrescine transport system substrate-binding protein n=2 Tax=Microbacterium azadirachtae TaxID=582680 RepID=A0A1I6G6P2_9MICO|nr:putative spermidine/putrescine transport system substrate-binding protein [Microbacterium azadirachtae]SEF66684.1 putative spermidine/putrescine transport system substrate-binding protein [Microbacterium azadirachtae]SEF67441.1 putative spermidine/putrescine transport system substrate-binding protein [Microbacterium azadirachtae]SFR37873.1 putative spermidine/putrescine transport system substrate-binding protein [Microbacterium azadirachtae]